MQVKQAVTGYGKAVKKQVQEMARILLHLPAIPKPDDTADAPQSIKTRAYLQIAVDWNALFASKGFTP